MIKLSREACTCAGIKRRDIKSQPRSVQALIFIYPTGKNSVDRDALDPRRDKLATLGRDEESVVREARMLDKHMYCAFASARQVITFFYYRNVPTCIEYARYLSTTIPSGDLYSRDIVLFLSGERVNERVTRSKNRRHFFFPSR